MNTSYFLVKEGQVVSPFVKISFEFSSTFRESVVRRTNTAESKSKLNGIVLVVCLG